jgi:uncharacterized protein (DUF2252 family)
MLSRKDSEQLGLKQRHQLSRSALAELAPRNFDPIDVLRQASKKHIERLIPIKFKLMSDSPFAFYRGSVQIMAADLGSSNNSGLDVQLCGDAHLKNFGFYATPGSDIVLDINDFDETMRAPFEWDVKRLAASIILAGRVAGDSDSRCKDAIRIFLHDYHKWIHRFSEMPSLEVARYRAIRNYKDPFIRSALKKAERSTPVSNLQKLTSKSKGAYHFIYKKDSMWEIEGGTRNAVLHALKEYRATLSPDHQFLLDRYKPVDVGFKVVGTGSVGTRDYVVLLFGRDENDPLFLQVKEELPSAYSPYYKDVSGCHHQGERVVRGQRALQVLSDLLLGWCSIEGGHYLVRQLNDHKSSIEPEELRGKRLAEYSRVCAELLAKGHARSGHPVALAAYLGKSDKAERALLQFAVTYANQVEADFDGFKKALKRGDLSKNL